MLYLFATAACWPAPRRTDHLYSLLRRRVCRANRRKAERGSPTSPACQPAVTWCRPLKPAPHCPSIPNTSVTLTLGRCQGAGEKMIASSTGKVPQLHLEDPGGASEPGDPASRQCSSQLDAGSVLPWHGPSVYNWRRKLPSATSTRPASHSCLGDTSIVGLPTADSAVQTDIGSPVTRRVAGAWKLIGVERHAIWASHIMPLMRLLLLVLEPRESRTPEREVPLPVLRDFWRLAVIAGECTEALRCGFEKCLSGL
jgi:hypothetical protein